ncbi:MAG: THUMP domain-containing protein [Candidatus Methanomethylicaceae archaeon]
MSGVVIVRMGGEIGIKSRPVRSIYERKIAKIVRTVLEREGIPFTEVHRSAGRIYVFTDQAEKASRSVARIFGVSSASAGIAVSSELNEIVRKGTELAISKFKSGSFAVRCRRSGHHEYTSMEVASLIGESILRSEKRLRVDLENPDQTLYVEIRDDRAYLYFESVKGPDGFPFGTQDHLLGVVDETKESLLAAWCMLKRGASLKAITYENCGAVPEGVLANLKKLCEWVPEARIETFIVSLTEESRKSSMSYELGVAISIAEREKINGVVSGLRPKTISALRPLSSFGVQVFFPLMALEDQTLDEWSRYIGIGEYAPDEKAFKDFEILEDQSLDAIVSNCRKIILSPSSPF